MANKIILKKSSVVGRVPNSGDLEVGEIAVNLSDGLLYSKNTTGTVIVVGSSTTSNIREGSNLYFTNTRAISALTGGENITIASNGRITATTTSGDIQYGGNVYYFVGDIRTKKYTGDNSTVEFNVDIAPYDANSLVVFVNSIVQSPAVNYTVSGNVITFTSAPEQDAEVIIKYIDSTDLGLSSSNVTEGSNLYFTNTRAISAFTAGNDITIDANGLITSTSTGGVSSVNGEVGDVVLVTANITEDTNLYYTDQRVYSNVTQLGYSTQTDLGVVFDQSNTNSTLIGISYNQANTATTYATSAFDASNTTATLVGIVYAQSNTKANVADLTTANVAEDTNLYYTDARVYSNVSQIGYATTGHVSSEIANLISSAPSTLDTLNELAAALGDDPNFATTTATLIGNAYNQGNAAYAQANIATTDARSAFDSGNTTFTLVGVAYDQANTATTYATSAFNAGNTTATLVGVVYDQSNAKANVADLTTANVTENTNLYYTNARVDAYLNSSDITVGGNLTVNGILETPNFSVSDTLTIGSQILYAQGTNGFSVNEDFDPSANALQTAYHFTSGAGRTSVAFTLARTGQFTNGFGIYGTAADNKLVNFGEQSNTSFEWRRGVGIQPLSLDGGVLLANISSAGNFYVTGNVFASQFFGNINGTVSSLSNLTTSDLVEGGNLYYTNTRVDVRVSPIFNQSNTNATLIGVTYDQANIATSYATSAFDEANTRVQTVAGVTDTVITNAQIVAAITDSSPEFQDVTVQGNLTVTGNVTYLNVEALEVDDNMIYLNANSTIANPDLGWAGNYNDGTYRHAGVFRDATDGIFKFFDQYEPEPDETAFIDTSNATFHLANVQATTFIGNVTGTVSSIANHNTDDLAEGSTNLYYTLARVAPIFDQANTATTYATSAFDASNTTATLVGIVYNQSNTKANVADLTTANIAEDTNLYFTNARARAAFTAGSNITIDANGVISSTATGGGGSLTYSVDTFTGDNSTSTFNLTSSPSSNVSLLISFDGVKQHVSEYTVANTSLTFNNAPESNVSIEVIHLPSEGGGGSSGASETWSEVTSDQTLVSSNKYMVNTSSGPITVTLPSSPSLGDVVYILDATNSFSSNNCLIARNSSKIMGVEDDLLADTNGSYFGLVYYNSTYGWRILQ